MSARVRATANASNHFPVLLLNQVRCAERVEEGDCVVQPRKPKRWSPAPRLLISSAKSAKSQPLACCVRPCELLLANSRVRRAKNAVMGLVVLAVLLASVPLALCLNNTLAQTPTVGARRFRSARERNKLLAFHSVQPTMFCIVLCSSSGASPALTPRMSVADGVQHMDCVRS